MKQTITPTINTTQQDAKSIFITASQGQLECMVTTPSQNVRGIAIIFHPSPLGGGNNTNKIVQIIAKTLTTQKHYICVCPNLRGVGLSDGQYDHGRGESHDAHSIYEYFINQYAALPIVLAGFSFGGYIAATLAQHVVHQHLILIAPALQNYQAVPTINNKTTTIIHGDSDDIVPLAQIQAWAKDILMPIVVVPNTEHFFHGRLLILQQLISNLQL